MTRAARFTKAELANAAKLAKDQGVSVRLGADGSITIYPGAAAEQSELDREWAAFEEESVAKVELKGVHAVRSKGRLYYYAWRGGPRLEGEPGSIEFLRGYQGAWRAERRRRTRRRSPRS